MGERKVVNKYYPPDFDPAKLRKIPKDRQCVVRLMAPFTMRCLTCENYVFKGKKFNARKETAFGEKYLSIQIYRFIVRCCQCLSEISFKTDPKNASYKIENGAYRTFQAVVQEKEEVEANNPILALEKRTKESRMEMDVLDALEEIRDWNARNAQVKDEDLMEKHLEHESKMAEEIEEQDKTLVGKLFRKNRVFKRLRDEDEEKEYAKLSDKANAELFEPDTKQIKKDNRDKLASMIVRKKAL